MERMEVLIFGILFMSYMKLIQCQFGFGGGGGGEPDPFDCYVCGQSDAEHAADSAGCRDPSTAGNIPTTSCTKECYAHTWFEEGVGYAVRGCDTVALDYCSSTQSCTTKGNCTHCCSDSNCNEHDPTEIQELSLNWAHCYECIQNNTWDECSDNGFNPYSSKVDYKTCHSGICATVTIPPISLVGLTQSIIIRKCDVTGSEYEACNGQSGCNPVDVAALLGFGGFPGIDPGEACCCQGHYCNGAFAPSTTAGPTTEEPTTTTMPTTQAPPTTTTMPTRAAVPTTKSAGMTEPKKTSPPETESSASHLTTPLMTAFFTISVALLFWTVSYRY